MRAGANPSAINAHGRTPVDEALSGEHGDILQFVNSFTGAPPIEASVLRCGPRPLAAAETPMDLLQDEADDVEEEGQEEEGVIRIQAGDTTSD